MIAALQSASAKRVLPGGRFGVRRYFATVGSTLSLSTNNLGMTNETPMFFEKPSQFRAWLKRNHTRCSQQWIGFHRKSSGLPSITWPESVDQALCFGWIDGLRKTVDVKSYKIR